MRSIVGISLIDFTIANGPSDKIVKGLRMPSKIESRPCKRELGEFIIYFDLEITNQNNIVNLFELKNNLKPLCMNFVDFGNYFSETVELD